MVLNSNEISLLLSELDFTSTFIQDVVEHSLHSYTFKLFSKSQKAWLFYIEVGSQGQRVCKTDHLRAKSNKMQRFTQYLKANIVGSRILSVTQTKGEREICFEILKNNEVTLLFIRLFSGPSSNIIITDSNLIIKELLMRRPKRGEEKGRPFTKAPEKEIDFSKFPIREYSSNSFNSEIDKSFSAESNLKTAQLLKEKIILKRDKELFRLNTLLKEEERKVKEYESFEEVKNIADLLSTYSHLIKKGSSEIKLQTFNNDEVLILLNRELTPAENILAYYQKYKRNERIYKSALKEIEDLKEKLISCNRYYDELLLTDKISILEKEVKKDSVKQKDDKNIGVKVISHGFEILIGRNANENDELLRHSTRGSDIWIHTRDYQGGYVFIKAKRDKSVPLEVLLDGAYLAIHFSKAKESKKASLYYTYVKYLRRPKDGKKGLVLPTQEKNLFVTLDERRVKELLST